MDTNLLSAFPFSSSDDEAGNEQNASDVVCDKTPGRVGNAPPHVSLRRSPPAAHNDNAEPLPSNFATGEVVVSSKQGDDKSAEEYQVQDGQGMAARESAASANTALPWCHPPPQPLAEPVAPAPLPPSSANICKPRVKSSGKVNDAMEEGNNEQLKEEKMLAAKRKAARERKAKSRANRSAAKADEERKKARIGMSNRRKEMTEEEKDVMRAKTREAMRKIRARQSAEQLTANRERERTAKAKRWEGASDEEVAARRVEDNERKRVKRKETKVVEFLLGLKHSTAC